jgi:hypothetical protein
VCLYQSLRIRLRGLPCVGTPWEWLVGEGEVAGGVGKEEIVKAVLEGTYRMAKHFV